MRPTNEWFEPERLGALYRTYLLLVTVLALVPGAAFLWWVIPTPVRWIPPAAAVLVAGFLAYWISRFDDTAAFRLTGEEVEYRRGVWWQKHSTVPYTRITNVESSQGPVHRYVGTGTVRLQTAGTGQQQPELSLSGLADYEAVTEQLLDAVREREPERSRQTGVGTTTGIGTTTAEGTPGGDALLAEVRRIRELLEES